MTDEERYYTMLDEIEQLKSENKQLQSQLTAKETTLGGTYIDINTHFRDIEKLKDENARLKAEIERLGNMPVKIMNGKIIRMETIKEFAETLKFMAKKDGAYDYVSWHQIDSVEKELTGKA